MPDIYFPDTILQLRAVPDFIGSMNQATHLSDCCEITSGRITDTFGFLNSHSFLMTPGNKLKTYNELTHVLTNVSTIGGTQYQNFTLETRVRFTSLTGIKYLFEIPGSSSSGTKRYGINAAGKLTFYSGASATVTQTDSEVITTGTDYHIAFVRGQGTQPGYNLKMFINGRKVVDVNNTTTNSTTSANGAPLVFGGSNYSDTYDVSGYMDDIRITLGVARYSSDFTPPINDDFTVPDSSLWLPVRPNIKAKTIINIPRNNLSLYPPIPSGSKKVKISSLAKHNVTNFDFTDYYGDNTINAVAQIDGVPSSGLLINLLHRGSKRIVRTTKSGIDGAYSIKNISSSDDYMILGEDDIKKPLIERRNAYVRDFVSFSREKIITLTKPTGNFYKNTTTKNFLLNYPNIKENTTVTITTTNLADEVISTTICNLTPSGYKLLVSLPLGSEDNVKIKVTNNSDAINPEDLEITTNVLPVLNVTPSIESPISITVEELSFAVTITGIEEDTYVYFTETGDSITENTVEPLLLTVSEPSGTFVITNINVGNFKIDIKTSNEQIKPKIIPFTVIHLDYITITTEYEEFKTGEPYDITVSRNFDTTESNIVFDTMEGVTFAPNTFTFGIGEIVKKIPMTITTDGEKIIGGTETANNITVTGFNLNAIAVDRDPLFHKVTLLIRPEDGDTSTSVTDKSKNNTPITLTNSITVETTDSPWPSKYPVMVFPSSLNNFITVLNDPINDLRDKSWCIEANVWYDAVSGIVNIFDTRGSSSSDPGLTVVYDISNRTVRAFDTLYDQETGNNVLISANNTIPEYQNWALLSISRNSETNITTFRVNGTTVGSINNYNPAHTSPTGTRIGANYQTNRDLYGKIDAVRFTMNDERYSGDFPGLTRSFELEGYPYIEILGLDTNTIPGNSSSTVITIKLNDSHASTVVNFENDALITFSPQTFELTPLNNSQQVTITSGATLGAATIEITNSLNIIGPDILDVEVIESDPNFNNVTLLINGEGENDSSVILDKSNNEHVITNNGPTTRITGGYGTVINFNSSSKYLQIPYSADLSLETSDFTVEAKFNIFTLPWQYQTLVEFRGSGAATESWVIYFNTINRNINIFDGVSNILVSVNDVIPVNGPSCDIAVVSSSGVLTFFVDGIKLNSVTTALPATHSSGIKIGINHENVSPLNGQLHGLRITKGVARYNANYDVRNSDYPLISS